MSAPDACQWCQSPAHAIELCPEVLAAFGPDKPSGNVTVTNAADPSKYRGRALTGRKSGRPHSGPGRNGDHDGLPCVVVDCDRPRVTGRPNCAEHEADARRARQRNRPQTGQAVSA